MAETDVPQEAQEPQEALDDEPMEVAADPLADAQAEIASLTDKLARARADYDNLVKRTERDAALERERVKARVLEGFLQVYEYGQMAVVEAEKAPGALAEGVKMVVREFQRVLEAEGLNVVGAVGDAFDTGLHEAVGEEPATDDVAAGHVLRVVKPGYKLGDRVLRYAQVIVAA
ncbi:MAG: nucleotide exchange factor GrpE [Thermoplasmatota archaeon]